jgi:ribosomal-protein-alanine N-acetyltransferase
VTVQLGLDLFERDGDAYAHRVRVRVLTASDAAMIASWRYPGRYSTYNVDDPSILRRGHWAVIEARQLAGYCCFGAPARVRGATAERGTLDVGYGLAPDRMGRGDGTRFVTALLRFARARYDPARFRLHILSWNERSLNVAARLGFSVEAVLHSDEGAFLVMVRQDSDPAPLLPQGVSA